MTAAAGSSKTSTTASTRGSRRDVRSRDSSGSRNVPTAAERRQEVERAAPTKQFFDMFQTVLVTLQEKYVPRAEYAIENQQQNEMMTDLTGQRTQVPPRCSTLR